METLEVGAKVRVLGGPFAGRVGVISELDGKGGARVTLGLLSARVLLENLRPARDVERPSLKSSHRRPASGGAEPDRTRTRSSFGGEVSSDGEGVRTAASRSKKTRSVRRSPSK